MNQLRHTIKTDADGKKVVIRRYMEEDPQRRRHQPRVITASPMLESLQSKKQLSLSVSFSHVRNPNRTVVFSEEEISDWSISGISIDARAEGCCFLIAQQSHVFQEVELTRFARRLLDHNTTLVILVEKGLRKPEFVARFSNFRPEVLWEAAYPNGCPVPYTRDGSRPLNTSEIFKFLDAGRLRDHPTGQLVPGGMPIREVKQLTGNDRVPEDPYLVQVEFQIGAMSHSVWNMGMHPQVQTQAQF
jgi:hypothetical protein